MFSIFDWRRKETAEIMKYKCRQKCAYMFCLLIKIQTTIPPFIADRHGILFYPRAGTRLFKITTTLIIKRCILLLVWFGRWHCVHGGAFVSFLFPHSRFSHWWCHFRRNRTRNLRTTRHSLPESQPWYDINVYVSTYYICHRLHFYSHHMGAPTNQNNKSNAYFCHRAARQPFHLLFVSIFSVSPQLNYPRRECEISSRRTCIRLSSEQCTALDTDHANEVDSRRWYLVKNKTEKHKTDTE